MRANVATADLILSRSTPEPNTGCWLWDGPFHNQGYGIIEVQRKAWKAHRLSFSLFTGAIPDGMFVCHRCDTPACVNPDHLFAGTARENIVDRHAKRRDARGAKCSGAKLTLEQVTEIRRSGIGIRPATRKYGVHRNAIREIVRGISWKG